MLTAAALPCRALRPRLRSSAGIVDASAASSTRVGLSPHVHSDERVAFFTTLSDSVMVAAFVLPLLSLLIYAAYSAYDNYTAKSGGGGAARAMTTEERLARDLAEERAIKSKASGSSSSIV